MTYTYKSDDGVKAVTSGTLDSLFTKTEIPAQYRATAEVYTNGPLAGGENASVGTRLYYFKGQGLSYQQFVDFKAEVVAEKDAVFEPFITQDEGLAARTVAGEQDRARVATGQAENTAAAQHDAKVALIDGSAP